MKGGLENLVLTLVDRGAKLDTQDNEGCTALMMAATKGHVNIARILIDKGGNNGACDFDLSKLTIILLFFVLFHAPLVFFLCSEYEYTEFERSISADESCSTWPYGNL